MRHIDLKRLRDEQVLSDLGVPLPAGVVSGQAKVSIQGEMGKPNRLIAEAIIFDPVRKTASTTACQTCPANATHMSLSPTSATGNVGANVAMTPRCHFTDGTSSIIGNPFALTWFPGNSSLISVSATWNSFKVNFLAPGSTTLNSNSTDCHWEFDFQTSSCGDCSTLDTLSLIQLMNLTVNPLALRGTVLNVPVTGDGQAVIANQSFTLQVEAINPNTGLRVTTYSGSANVNLGTTIAGDSVTPSTVSLTNGVGTATVNLKGVNGQARNRTYTLAGAPASPFTGSVNVWFSVSMGVEFYQNCDGFTTPGSYAVRTACDTSGLPPNSNFIGLPDDFPSAVPCGTSIKVKNRDNGVVVQSQFRERGPGPLGRKYWNGTSATPTNLSAGCVSDGLATQLGQTFIIGSPSPGKFGCPNPIPNNPPTSAFGQANIL